MLQGKRAGTLAVVPVCHGLGGGGRGRGGGGGRGGGLEGEREAGVWQFSLMAPVVIAG